MPWIRPWLQLAFAYLTRILLFAGAHLICFLSIVRYGQLNKTIRIQLQDLEATAIKEEETRSGPDQQALIYSGSTLPICLKSHFV